MCLISKLTFASLFRANNADNNSKLGRHLNSGWRNSPSPTLILITHEIGKLKTPVKPQLLNFGTILLALDFNFPFCVTNARSWLECISQVGAQLEYLLVASGAFRDVLRLGFQCFLVCQICRNMHK